MLLTKTLVDVIYCLLKGNYKAQFTQGTCKFAMPKKASFNVPYAVFMEYSSVELSFFPFQCKVRREKGRLSQLLQLPKCVSSKMAQTTWQLPVVTIP